MQYACGCYRTVKGVSILITRERELLTIAPSKFQNPPSSQMSKGDWLLDVHQLLAAMINRDARAGVRCFTLAHPNGHADPTTTAAVQCRCGAQGWFQIRFPGAQAMCCVEPIFAALMSPSGAMPSYPNTQTLESGEATGKVCNFFQFCRATLF